MSAVSRDEFRRTPARSVPGAAGPTRSCGDRSWPPRRGRARPARPDPVLPAHKGLSSWKSSFFTSDPNLGQCFPHVPARHRRRLQHRRIRSALLGTLEIVGLATLIAVPDRDHRRAVADRVRQAVVVREYRPLLRGRDDRRPVDRVRPVRASSLLVVSHVGGDSVGWKGAVALALLMLPIVTRSAEVVLLARALEPA